MSVYLDYAATTPLHERALDAMLRCQRDAWANPSAVYASAGAARRELRLARAAVAILLGCDAQEVFFTSGGTESNNWALSACAERHAVVSAIEHASVLEAARRWAGEVTLVQPDENGIIQPEAVARSMRPNTVLVSVQWANNETGVLQPVEAIARAAHAGGALFHTDAVQAFGHVPVNAHLCDLMSVSAHKLYGPRGAGALYIRQGAALAPLLAGGGQESGLRAGTENIPAIAGFGAACELASADMDMRAREERALMADFLHCLPGVRMLGQNAPRLPGVGALCLPLPAEAVIAALDLRGIEVSGGAACAARSHTPSHVYRAMGLSEAAAARIIRVSVGRGITKQALAQAARALVEICSL